jgi:hypothetical protein
MDLIIGGALAIAGGLLGQVVAYFFGRRNAVEANTWNRNEKLRQERIVAYSEFAGAVNAYRRAMIDRAFATIGSSHVTELEDLESESRRSRDIALRYLYLVELLCDDPDVAKAAQDSYYAMDSFVNVRKDDDVEATRNHTRRLIRRFVRSARNTIDLGPAS